MITDVKKILKTIESNQRSVLIWVISVTTIMATLLFVKINRFAVNILFSDQWDTYQTIFNGNNAWQIFFAQSGQLRLGVGGVICDAVAFATGWNTRAEAFSIGLTMVLITAAAIYLKWRLFNEFTLWDALIPLICLSASLTEVPIVVPFPSHSTAPILLFLLYAICLTFEQSWIRFGLSAVINFLAIFTGWGLFVGFLTPILLVYLIFSPVAAVEKPAKIWASAALLLSVLSLALYFYDYQVFSGVACFTLPHFPLLDYLWFASVMLSNSIGFSCGKRVVFSNILGMLLVLIFAVVLLSNYWKLLRARKFDVKNLVTAIFLTFSAFFVLGSTVGRACQGECAAVAGRYQPLLIPAWLALYFAFLMIENRKNFKIRCLACLLVCFFVPQIRTGMYQDRASDSRDFKLKWKACYLEKEDAAACDKETGDSIFSPVSSLEAQSRINYLKQNHLNFFADK